MTITDAFGNEYDEYRDECLPAPRPYRPKRARSAPLRNKDQRTKVQEFDPDIMARVFQDTSTPETPMQALVEADVFCEPEESALERELRLEPIRLAIEECLTERERWVIECKFWRGLGLDRTAALTATELGLPKNLSKTHVARIRDEALRKLREHLEKNL